MKRGGTQFFKAQRAIDRWERRWEDAFVPMLAPRRVDELAAAGARDWEDVRMALGDGALMDLIRSVIGSLRDFVSGGLAVYLSLGADTSEEAGQYSLDSLGLNQTFRWNSPRDMSRDLFAVRGSKVIQRLHGNHIEALRDIVIEATDPRHPKTARQVRREIEEEWDRLSRSEASRIARTETAAVWETTSFNVNRVNGVRWYDWIVARGPSIGPPRSAPVCKRCLRQAAGGPYPVNEVELPPLHPNCRCTLVPSLNRDWLPPAETWDGGPNPPMPLVPAKEL